MGNPPLLVSGVSRAGGNALYWRIPLSCAIMQEYSLCII